MVFKVLSFGLACVLGVGMAMAEPEFQAAKPIWIAGRETRMNDFAGFMAFANVPEGATNVVLRITASSVYRARFNDQFLGYGPARAAKGFYRVDEWPLKDRLVDGVNLLQVEVSGYNCNTFYICDAPAFLEAEIVADGQVLAHTAADGDFTAVELPRVKKVSRFSYQRAFSEVYRPGNDLAKWWWSNSIPPTIAEQSPKRHLARRALYPAFTPAPPMTPLAATRVTPRENFQYRPVRQVDKVGGTFKAYPSDALEVNVWRLLQEVEVARDAAELTRTNAWTVARAGVLFDNGREQTGFPMLTVTCRKAGRLVVAFDEVLTQGLVDPLRFEIANAVVWDLEPGTFQLEAFEPYSLRYLHVYTLDGEMTVSDARLRPYENPAAARVRFAASDPAVTRIFEAARATFAQNTVDGFMDCPSRERAGWLCDSFFTGRASLLFTGSTELEKLFLENYLLPKSFEPLPEGALPMCYPGDHPDGVFIPNWMMWLVLELDEYARRSGDKAFVEAFRPRMLALYRYLGGFRNSDGLLERLPSWIFVEWSRANRLVRDVNYPSNMTWAEVLDALDRLYDLPELRVEAKRVRETVRKQSWTGKWFCDNAVRQADGTLKLSGECTETCQYYAFMFGTATAETYPELWRTLVAEFGPKRFDPADRKKLLAHPEIAPSNAFIGNYLRLELLARAGLSQQLLDETKGYFTYMVKRTGTLWEHDGASASCNHGFASYAAALYVRALLGLTAFDPVAKTFSAQPPHTSLTSCELSMPISGEIFSYGWVRNGDKFVETVRLPTGWHRLR